MAITPMEQFQREITFCTPGINGRGFPDNYINLIYETDDNGNMPDDFLFAKVISGKFQWEQLNVKFPGQDELFAKKINGKQYAVKIITLPGDGVYKIKADSLFAAYSFGYSDYDSYGYPTSSALADMEKADSSAPIPTYTLENDGSVKGAIITDMPNDDSLRSNLALIFMDNIESYNYTFDYEPFIAGETRSTNWTLTVIDKNKDAKATLLFSDRCGNDTTIVVEYTAPVNSVHSFGGYGEVKITPNPATDYIEIAITDDRTLKDAVKVYDVLGVCVATHPLAPPREGVAIRRDVSGLAAGVYFVRVGGKMYKFVKM
jgi:hypothetical protein